MSWIDKKRAGRLAVIEENHRMILISGLWIAIGGVLLAPDYAGWVTASYMIFVFLLVVNRRRLYRAEADDVE